MAARSSGIFPREGFNIDAACTITGTPTAAAVTLKHAKTIRVIVLNLAGTSITVTLGGEAVTLTPADADKNGVAIAHIRGALCVADNNVSYSGTNTNSGVFYELVDGAKR